MSRYSYSGWQPEALEPKVGEVQFHPSGRLEFTPEPRKGDVIRLIKSGTTFVYHGENTIIKFGAYWTEGYLNLGGAYEAF